MHKQLVTLLSKLRRGIIQLVLVKLTLYKKWLNLIWNKVDIGSYKSHNAEIFIRDKFGGDTKMFAAKYAHFDSTLTAFLITSLNRILKLRFEFS